MRGQFDVRGLVTTPFPARGGRQPRPWSPVPGQRSHPAWTTQGRIGEEETWTLISTFLRFGFSTLAFTRTEKVNLELQCPLGNLIVQKEFKIKPGLQNIILQPFSANPCQVYGDCFTSLSVSDKGYLMFLQKNKTGACVFCWLFTIGHLFPC